jgi:glycosyltransferase involved in cell wall biosynthesis
MKYSVIVPVYKNQDSIPDLLNVLSSLNQSLNCEMEVVFVVDGSPDQCHSLLLSALDSIEYPAQLIAHSRNFGSFPAVRTGLIEANGEYFAIMAADLQEPPELIQEFFGTLAANECDIVVGTRNCREDPFFSRISSRLFWGLYRRLVVSEMPAGGIDIFGCNKTFRDNLVKLEESRSSLISLIFWLGFRRSSIGYNRGSRNSGKSAWTLNKKMEYMMDSVFAFTDYPIRWMLKTGVFFSLIFLFLAVFIAAARLAGAIEVPGYTPTILAILFIGGMNFLGLGFVGTYAWRAYENSKGRPLAVVASVHISDSLSAQKSKDE